MPLASGLVEGCEKGWKIYWQLKYNDVNEKSMCRYLFDLEIQYATYILYISPALILLVAGAVNFSTILQQ